MNYFVDYLNSTNNVGGNSTGSLAEMQVKSQYYDVVKVDRKLGTYIAECVKSGQHQAFILTGHAGDGKTSILVQVLKELHKLAAQEGLCEYKEYDDFLYVKDMSEIAPEQQNVVLKKALEAPQRHKTSLVISNTGPLLKACETLVENEYQEEGSPFSHEERLELQSKLLKQLDSNEDKPINIGKHEATLVNIARVDNVPFAVRILKNILLQQLWSPCEVCECANRCPIKNNCELVHAQFSRVSAFVENWYRYLYENDKRMTIRQMVGQISYALTGNLTCEEIRDKRLRQPFFNYNFANLFFGYRGLKPDKNATQIEGIRQIRNMELDRISLYADYNLFVKQDYSCFMPNIKNELVQLNHRYRKHYQVVDDSLFDDKKYQTELQLRQAVRRFYLMFSLTDSEQDTNAIMNEIFGDNYTSYKSLISKKQNKQVLRAMQTVVFKALYMKNTGFLPGTKSELPLTLRREDDVFQNVMIVLGTVDKKRLNITQEKISNRFEDADEKYQVCLKMEDSTFVLSLPMVTYFDKLINGAIASNDNPALSHGIAKLDTILLEQYGNEKPECEEECELTVIINTTNGQTEERFSFSQDGLVIEM